MSDIKLEEAPLAARHFSLLSRWSTVLLMCRFGMLEKLGTYRMIHACDRGLIDLQSVRNEEKQLLGIMLINNNHSRIAFSIIP